MSDLVEGRVDATRMADARARVLLETMHGLAEGTDDYPRLLDAIARRLSEVIGDAAAVLLISEQDPNALTLASLHARDASTATRIRELHVAPLRLDAHPSPDYLALEKSIGMHSVLVLPLRSHGAALGIVTLWRHLPTSPAFDDADRTFAETLAVHASLAISNARSLAARDDAEAQSSQLRAQRDSERMFHLLLEAAPDAMVIVGADGKIVLVNAQTERLFGFGRAEMLGQTVEMLVPPRFQAGHVARRAGFFGAPNFRAMGSGLELFGRRRDGSEFPLEISLSPIDTENGTLVSSTIRDVSERKRTESALKLANRELEAFSYSVAHDLRAPLRAMNGFARMLIDEHASKLDAEGIDWLQEIVLNAKKMAELIDAMLALSRVTRAELKPANVSLSNKARSIADQLAIAEPGRSVEIVIQPDLQAQVDPGLARAVLQNLIGNAWKFTRDTVSARIEVGVEDVEGSPAFFVRDNGAGFDMAYANKLFAPFQRLHTVTEFAGTGVGLATVQRIVHRHGGRVWAEAKVGEGAVFHFTLPRPCAERESP